MKKNLFYEVVRFKTEKDKNLYLGYFDEMQESFNIKRKGVCYDYFISCINDKSSSTYITYYDCELTELNDTYHEWTIRCGVLDSLRAKEGTYLEFKTFKFKI